MYGLPFRISNWVVILSFSWNLCSAWFAIESVMNTRTTKNPSFVWIEYLIIQKKCRMR